MSTPQTIVIVEDDASMNLAIERLLSAAGWSVITFTSGEALLESTTGNQASGFVFDIHLPGISGFELHRRLVATGVKAPVVFITAHDQFWARTQAEHMGAAGYLTKPFQGHRLIEALHTHCLPA